MSARSRILCILISTVGFAAAAPAQESASGAIDGPPPPVPPAVVSRDETGRVTMRAVRLDQPLRVDGALDDEVYTRVHSASDFIQQEPEEGRPATEKTEVWLFYAARNVYIAARCWDSQPQRMVATEMRRDNFNIFQGENFTAVLDTFHDRRTGFFFQTNPVGGLRDGLVTDEKSTNYDWSTVWESKSRRAADGWTLEMAIPFKSLRYRSGTPQVWGVNFRRVVRWKNETSHLTPIPASYSVRGITKFSSAATLVGIEPPPRSRNLELKPYTIASLTTNRQAAAPFSNHASGDAGLDVKYGLTRGLILDLTYNTDFAQVEEDEQQVNLTRFSLFFPEKRDFFLEGEGIFAFGGVQVRSGGPGSPGASGGGGRSNPMAPLLAPTLFFSRRIGLSGGQAVPILAGGRLTGRAGSYTVGALQIRTGQSAAAGARTTDFSVLRVKRDILRRSNVGLIATRRWPSLSPRGSNTVVGLDANLALHQDLNVNGYLARSDTPAFEAPASQQWSYRGQVEYAGDRYGLVLEHLLVGERFNPEIGFLRREAFRRSYGEIRFSPRPRSSRVVRKAGLEASVDYITDPRGRLETRETQGTLRLELHNNDKWTVDYTRHFEGLRSDFRIAEGVVIPSGGYRFQDVKSVYELGPQRRLSGSVTLGRGGFFGGHRTEAGYRGRVDASARLTLEPGVSVNWVDLPQGRFTTRLLSGRASLALSPRAFVSAFTQYNSSTGGLSSSVRLRWEYRPGSDLFVVWSEGRDTTVAGSPRLDNRTFVVKLTRLFRF